MSSTLFAGSGALTRLILRRDRLRLAIWLVSMAGLLIALVPVFADLLLTEGDNAVMAQMMQNPAMIALVGPVYGADSYTIGPAYANMMTVFTAIAYGIMNILLVSRHTRQDEELGRLEVVRSLPVGRLANPAAALTTSLGVNAAFALVTGLGLWLAGPPDMTLSGCLLFAAATASAGLFFAGATALLCQLTANNRTATGLSFLLMLVLYILRALGDMGTEALALLSPLGLVTRTRCFVDNAWWPVLSLAALSAAVAAVALLLAGRRDLGRGLAPERPGRRHASPALGSAWTLALKLLRSTILVWAVAVFVLAAMYGSVFGEFESFFGSNEMLRLLFAASPGHSVTDQFVGLLMVIMSMVGVVAPLSIVGRAAAEERRGHAEHLWARTVSRRVQLAAYVVPAAVMCLLIQALTALGFWSVGSMVAGDLPSLGVFLTSAMSYVPAMLVMVGVAVALAALRPGWVSAAYAYVGLSVVVIYLGAIAGFPQWTKRLSPFGFVPQYPVEEIGPGVMLGLLAVAAALIAFGFVRYGRREMQA